MAFYSYYNTLPSWGTSQFQPIPPPTPRYRPLSSWTGNDYFAAHSGTRDNTVFDYVWYKMRDFVMGTGYGRNHAFRWWKRLYSGLATPASLLPKEIGAAAGYEAIRIWETHNGIYAAPMNADQEREREALVGVAAAEATRLWAYTGRPQDKWGRLEASETAAATASRIFLQEYTNGSVYEPFNRVPKSVSFGRNSWGGRRASTPIPSSSGLRYRPPTPYNGPSVVDTLASPVSSYGNTLNMTGMDGALPPLASPYPAPGTPLGSPYLDGGAGGGRGYIPSPIDDYPDGFDGYDDYEGGPGYGSYGENFGGGRYGNSGYAGGIGGPGYGGYGGIRGGMGMGGGMGGMGMDGFGGIGAGLASPGLGYGGGSAFGPELDNGIDYMNQGVGPYGGSATNPSNVVYDPILGPGIQGTYYPKVAQMQRLGLNGGSYGYPGASVGLPPPPGTYSTWPRRGLRRTRSFF